MDDKLAGEWAALTDDGMVALTAVPSDDDEAAMMVAC